MLAAERAPRLQQQRSCFSGTSRLCVPRHHPSTRHARTHTHTQARRLDIRLRTPKNQGPEQQKLFVHMLNSTLSATERTLCCLLENYQTPEGVRVPELLQPFLPGIDFIPFRKAFDAHGKLVDRPQAAAQRSTAQQAQQPAAAAVGAAS